MQPTIFALTDDRAGNNSQVLGVAEKLGIPFEVIDLQYNFLAKLPSILLGASRRHLTSATRKHIAHLTDHPPMIVISAGRRSAIVSRWIKKQHPSTFICSIMGPDGGEDEFDLIALPKHDKIEDSRTRGLDKNASDTRHPTPETYLYTLTSPHPITHEKLSLAAGKWQPLFANKPKPWISVLVGGSTRHAEFSLRDYQALSEALARIRNASGGTLFITTSRRTSGQGVKALQQYLFSDDVFFAYKKDLTPSENPYLGLLAQADSIIVTGDSVSMCSEAISTGKPVYIYAPDEDKLAPKFQRFLNGLYAGNHARGLIVPLDDNWHPAACPDSASLIANKILSR